MYEVVRAKALVRAPIRDQIAALRNDPSADMAYEIAHVGGARGSTAAFDVPRAWAGIASNKSLGRDLLQRLTDMVLDRLDDESGHSPAHRALFDVFERG